jgi:hypothetical protein
MSHPRHGRRRTTAGRYRSEELRQNRRAHPRLKWPDKTTRGPGRLFDLLVATYSLLVRAVYTWQSPRDPRRRPPQAGNDRYRGQEARQRPDAVVRITHPGVGPLTALAYVLIIGTPARFHGGKQVGTYMGMIPSEVSSAGMQRRGHISQQGNERLRFLLVEAAQAAVCCESDSFSASPRIPGLP